MNNRWKDFINIKEKEVQFSIILSILAVVVINLLDVYKDFLYFEDIIQSILLEITGGMIGLLGFALSGVAIIVSLFSEKQIRLIELYNEPGIIEKIMTSFVFLSICSVMNIMISICINIAISSNKTVVDEFAFYILAIIVIYLICFTLVYTVNLVYGCIELFTIKKTYAEVEKKDFFHKANELRINFILISLLRKYKISEEDMVEELDRMTDAINDKDEQKLKEYFHRSYLDNN